MVKMVKKAGLLPDHKCDIEGCDGQTSVDYINRKRAERELCDELSNAGMKWVDPPGEARGYGLNPKAIWDALVAERLNVSGVNRGSRKERK